MLLPEDGVAFPAYPKPFLIILRPQCFGWDLSVPTRVSWEQTALAKPLHISGDLLDEGRLFLEPLILHPSGLF